jgi:hypothetical protein
LRLQVDSLGNSLTWTAKVEPLYLDEAAMRAHLDKLGPDLSIIDAVTELLPDQLRLIQERTKFRDGRLVSVQQSAPADMVTPMSTFKINSFVFVIGVAKLLEREESTAEGQAFLPTTQWDMHQTNPHAKSSLFGASNLTPLGHTAPNNNTSSLFSGAPVTKPDASPSSELSLFKASSQRVSPPQGEVCFVPLEEKDGAGNARSRCMSITFTVPYQSHSFEELRVKDYAAGRSEPMKVEVKYNGLGARPFSDGRPFGGQNVHHEVAGSPRPATDGFFGDEVTEGSRSGGGLFGGGCTTGHSFGRPATGGLFGGSGTSNNIGGGLFGGGGGFGRTTAPSSPDARLAEALYGRPATISPLGCHS